MMKGTFLYDNMHKNFYDKKGVRFIDSKKSVLTRIDYPNVILETIYNDLKVLLKSLRPVEKKKKL